MHLFNRGILLDVLQELDWSGRGQHVEYGPEDAGAMPLVYERTLGHDQTAIVDSVRCRRIRLARKKITCNRRLKKEDVVVEVEHLLRLQHSHIVRVVGTYTFKQELAILLYPAAEWDLDKYMDDILDDSTGRSESSSNFGPAVQALVTFYGCLFNAVDFIHEQNIKHMDIKPKNLLVRMCKGKGYRIYIADFGIARAYTSAVDVETDSPTPFTRAYAAPEVVDQDKRGFSADIFSLGCVFMEMMATLSSCLREARDERQILLEVRKTTSGTPAFYANIDAVARWYKLIIYDPESNLRPRYNRDYGPSNLPNEIVDIVPNMIAESSGSRPSASTLKDLTAVLCCSECHSGPEPFEAAD